MAESAAGDKTEAPTPRRRQEAREQGNLARSPDLSAAVLLLGALWLMRWFGAGIIVALRSVISEMLSPRSLADLDGRMVGPQVLHLVGQVGMSVAPLLGGAVLIAVAVNVAQVGLNLNGQRLVPNLAALSPFRGLSKLLGGGRGPVFILMNVVKILLVGLVAYSAVGGRLGQIIAVQQLSFQQIFGLGCEIVFSIGVRVAMLLLFLAILDYIYQRYRLEQSLRMTKQEVKDEMRRMEGDPLMKQRRRQIAVQRAVQKLKKDVPKADVVVTNPTHYAIALKYEEGKMRAPRLVAKGADFMAQRIRELASEAGVPIVERPTLARAIYRMIDVGEEIPEQFYSAVAEILAYVYELNRRAGRAAAAPAA
jgi:flagellar biosynthetic protein FlhB